MKNVILYWTKTGHSRKLAQAMSEALQIPALNLKEHPELDGIDTIFLVGGIYGGQSDPTMLEALGMIDRKMVAKVVLITSCTSGKTQQDQARKVLEDRGIQVVKQEFICKGSFLIFGWGHPNKDDFTNAVQFASTWV